MNSANMRCVVQFVTGLFLIAAVVGLKRRDDKTKCPEVKAIKNFNLQELLGSWFVVEYFASAEEALSYSCMRAVFAEDETVNQGGTWTPRVTMNFTYSYTDDPDLSSLLGNITWRVDPDQPAHWTHEEDTYEGIYNTYILDTEYKSWALLLHCAEKAGSARFLSAFVLSRTRHLPRNVLSYLRDKLPRYDVDPRYVFAVPHERCAPRARHPPAPLLVPLTGLDDRTPQDAYRVD